MADQVLFTRTLTGEDAEPMRSFAGADERARSRSYGSSETVERRAAGRKFLILIAAILTLFAGTAVVFEYVIAPRMVIRNFSIESDLNISRDTILQVAGVADRPRFFDLNTNDVVSRLQAWAPVRHATVVKVFPDTLRISITGRKPIGMAMVSENGHEFPVAFDEDGVIFASGTAVAGWDLPIFSGIEFKNFSLGVTLPPMLLEFVREVKELKLSSPGLYDLISEYRIIPRNDHEFDVMVYPVHHRVAVEIGPHIDRTLCMYILRVLDVMGHQGTLEKVKEIDFRTNDVVYTMKEEG